MLQRDEAGDRGGAVQIGHEGDGRAGEVQRGGQAISLAVVGDLLGLQHSARGQQVGMQNVHGTGLDHLAKAIPQVELFAGGRGCLDGIGHLLVAGDVPPGHGVFQPGQAIRFHRLTKANDLFGGHQAMPEVVRAQGDVPSGRLAHGGDDLNQASDAGIRDAGPVARSRRAPALAQRILVSGRRADQPAGRGGDQRRPHVELDEGQPQRLTSQNALDVGFGGRLSRRGCVGVDADAIAVLAAQELVAWHAVDLAGQVPQRDLDARNASSFPAPVAEVLDGPEDHVHVAGVLAQQHAFILERVLPVPGIAHLADAVDSLVRVNADDGIVVIAAYHRHAQVGDPKLRRAGVNANRVLHPTYMLLILFAQRHENPRDT